MDDYFCLHLLNKILLAPEAALVEIHVLPTTFRPAF